MAYNIHFLSCNSVDQKPDKNLSGLKAKDPKECIPFAGSLESELSASSHLVLMILDPM